jgi:5-methylcytosine-specific restriction endonuclease McrA
VGSALANATRPQRIETRRKSTSEENAALRVIRKEAHQRGASLHSGGKGGLPSTLVLGVFRRDEWKCKKCGGQTDLLVHHKAGLDAPISRWLLRKGKSNTPNNIVTLCARCHDCIHDEDREVAKAVEDSGDGNTPEVAARVRRRILRL